MYDLGIIALVGIAAFVMLPRGDPKWTLPALIGAVALFLVPTVTMLTIAFFTPRESFRLCLKLNKASSSPTPSQTP